MPKKYGNMLNILPIRWRFIVSITLVIIFALIITVFWTSRQVRTETNESALEKVKSDLRLGEALVESRLPGPWEIRDGNLYKGGALINENHAIVDEIGELTGDTCTIFQGDTRVATNVIRDDRRAVKDLARVERWIRRLKDLGCCFALDDFGMGFSSFSYLRTLPVDYLKIDGTYISNLHKDSTHIALVQAMNNIAHALGKKTIAEFVENEEILKMLHDLQIDCGQGYYLGRPGPAPV